MNNLPLSRLEIITLGLTAGILSPSFGNALADVLSAVMVGTMLVLMVLWIKYGGPTF